MNVRVATTVNRLSARTVSTTNKAGLHADGAGLYLRVDPSGAKRWTFIFRWHGKRKELGLGSLNTVSLSDAREHAREARQSILNGENPIDRSRRERAARGLDTFGALADELVEKLSPQWRSSVQLALIKAIGCPCPYCGRPMDFCQRRPSRDHLTPRSRGGTNHPSNRIICCARCNSHKGDYTLNEWLARLRSYGDARTIHVATFLLPRG